MNEASAAADAELTVGSHPIFRLPQEAGRAKLLLPRCACVRTYPQQTDEHSRLLPNARCDSPERVPLRDGGVWDCTRVPLPENVEELLFLGGVEEGQVTLENKDEGYAVTVESDPRDYASLMLWFSNRGRTFAPWNGTNLCLGVEPITGPLDLGDAPGYRPPSCRGRDSRAHALPQGGNPRVPSSHLHSPTVSSFPGSAGGRIHHGESARFSYRNG